MVERLLHRRLLDALGAPLAEGAARAGQDDTVDGLGTVVGRVGSGDFKILYDGHIDCVGVGDAASWDFDPFAGKHLAFQFEVLEVRDSMEAERAAGFAFDGMFC